VQLHLIDATYELFRVFHAIPPIAAPDGRNVAAVYGLVSSMLSLVRDPQVTHVACATDHVIESFRNGLYAGYKTGEGVPEALLAQWELAEEGLRALGLVVWPMIEFEADDALATAAARWADQVDKVVIGSVDKDLAQCIRGDRVVLWDRRREKVYDEPAAREKWGVAPARIPDLLALIGDTADGLPGIDGWGKVSAGAVLAAFPGVEAIPDDPREWAKAGVKVRGAERLARSLADARADARLFQQLATLRTDVPLAESLDDLRWRGVPRETFVAFCERLGFKRLPERPTRWAVA
jgi:5'-3' exonuclease